MCNSPLCLLPPIFRYYRLWCIQEERKRKEETMMTGRIIMTNIQRFNFVCPSSFDNDHIGNKIEKHTDFYLRSFHFVKYFFFDYSLHLYYQEFLL